MLSGVEVDEDSVLEGNSKGHSSQSKNREAGVVSSPKLDKSSEGDDELEKVQCN